MIGPVWTNGKENTTGRKKKTVQYTLININISAALTHLQLLGNADRSTWWFLFLFELSRIWSSSCQDPVGLREKTLLLLFRLLTIKNL